MTNREILQMAMEQSALDINCKAEDFLCDYPVCKIPPGAAGKKIL